MLIGSPSLEISDVSGGGVRGGGGGGFSKPFTSLRFHDGASRDAAGGALPIADIQLMDEIPRLDLSGGYFIQQKGFERLFLFSSSSQSCHPNVLREAEILGS